MKKILLVVVVFLLLIKSNVYAYDTSASSIVIDTDSGRVLYEKNADEKRLIASITKIMTAVIAIENKNLDDVVIVGDEVNKMYGSNIYIKPGEKLRLRDLLYGLILRSGNDAAVAIAYYVSGSEEDFVKMMNEKAKKIGMSNTTFRNCHGLDEETQNYSTARDMSFLAKYATKLFDYAEIASTKNYKLKTNYNSYSWINRNKLLKEYEYATGGKTGYTPKAGKTFVSTASKNNLNLTIVTLSDNDMYNTHKELYDYYFSKYKNVLIIDKDNISFGNNPYGDLYVKNDFYYPLTEDEKEKVKVDVDLYNLTDFSSDDKIGEIYVTFDNDEIFRENVYVKNTKKDNESFFSKVLKFFSSLFD